jgi:hypothetical protein
LTGGPHYKIQNNFMQTTTEITAVFETTLERAFKSPMLCDVTKVHTGYGPAPKVTHCTEDESWGKVGGSRKVFSEKSLFYKGGEPLLDTVLERIENKYWKIEVGDFKFWMLGFEKFQGEWFTSQLPGNKVQIRYRYTMFSNSTLLYPFQWVFTKVIWRNYMKHVLENIRQLVRNNEPYLHA